MAEPDTGRGNVETESNIRYRVLKHVVGDAGDTGAPQPDEDDDNHSFFARGRDLESAYVNHKYTEKEREILAQYESLDYLPPHSKVYRDWITRQPARLDWDRWVMMGLIGFAVGFVGFLLHQLIDLFAELKQEKARELIEAQDFFRAWLWVTAISVGLVMISSGTVVFIRPSAGGSGIPEIIAFLNGTLVRHIFNIKTLIVKFVSCVCAVSSGMPVGPEGPMIHLGALIGAGLSQFRSGTFGFRLPFFSRFRNSEDRRNFVSAGAAAGIASAFGAPVGGLLFSMEEVSSFWNMKLSWQTFFCCMVSTFTTDLFNSAFEAFQYRGDFGLFKTEKYILFQVDKEIAVNIIAVIPTVIVGAAGGILGAVFTFINLKIARARRRLLAKMNSPYKQLVQLCEPVLIMIIMGTLMVFLPTVSPCATFTCHWEGNGNPFCNPKPPIYTEKTVEHFNCPKGTEITINGTLYRNGTFNPVATLLSVTGEKAVKHLFSRQTHLEFDFIPLMIVLPCYFLLACWASGTAISSGVVVPKMFIGGMIGRIVGRGLVALFGVNTSTYWLWIDPGAFALLGAAAFFGGVSRLTMSLTVIMMELTNDIQVLLLIMVAIMVAKWVGDFVTHPFYHSLLEFKCIPFLDSEPVIYYEGKKNLNLELYTIKYAMTSPVVTLQKVEKVSHLAKLLLMTKHGGFPLVCNKGSGLEKTFSGLLTRTELSVMLCHQEIFQTNMDVTTEEPEVLGVDYSQFCDDDAEKLKESRSFKEMLERLQTEQYDEYYLNLLPYANQSAMSIPVNFSLHRTYIIFRSLGLRHLTVVTDLNQVIGIITRKDLMGYQLEEKLSSLVSQRLAFRGGELETFRPSPI